jgi:hypothetical protein
MVFRVALGQPGLNERRSEWCTMIATKGGSVNSALCGLAFVFVLGFAAAPAEAKSSNVAPTAQLKSFSANASIAISTASAGEILSFQGVSVFAAPANQDCKVTGSVGPLHLSEHAVVIGKSVWADEGSGFKKAKLADLNGQFICASTASFWKQFPLSSPAGIRGTPDTVNGIKSMKYDLSTVASSLSGHISSLPADVTVTSLVIAYGGSKSWVDLLDMSFTAATSDTCNQLSSGAVTLTPPCSITIHVDVANPNGTTLKVRPPSTK